MFFFKNCAENEAERLISDFFWLFQKVLYEVKVNGQHLSFNILVVFNLRTCYKNKLYEISDC